MLNWVPDKKIDESLVNKYFKKTIETSQFTNYGPNVRLLEEMVRNKLQVDDSKSVIAVNNGSIAIHILATAIQFKEQKQITWATQSFTFPPSAQANLQHVIIKDIDLEGGINLVDIDESIDGIIITNIFGNVVNISKYETWAKNNNKYIIFDNAATCHTFYKGKNCINYGIGCGISFHHTKPFGFGEGGAIIVDKKYETEVRCLINFGINLTDEYFVKEGTNGKMSDIAAVYILQYWENYFDIIVKKHIELYTYLKDQIKNRNIIFFKLFPSFHDENNTVLSCISILFDDYNIQYETKLLENHIFCRKYYHPLKNTPNAEYIYNHILCIPCTIDMSLRDIDRILDILSNVIVNV